MGRLGYSSITLTDLTETLPVFLTLESNLSNNIQKKNGSLYTPDFKTGDGVIITPSLFIGAKEEPLIKDIYYIVDGNEYHTVENEIESGNIAINSQGQLVIKENINHSYEISAFIDNFTIGEHGHSTNVKSRNKISIFVLEESSTYTAVISSNREHFDENNTSDIVLTAQFYKGTEEVVGATYVWDGLTDDDSSSTDSGSNINGTSKELILSRAQVKGTEVISCTMTDLSTGLSFIATKTIRDYVDEYRADLLPSSSLILTPNNTSVDLTARVWHKTDIINEEENEGRFRYSWQLINSNGTMANESIGANRILTIDTSSGVFPKENFTIACTITIDEKTAVSAYQNITYSPIEYTVNVEPKQAWLNVDSDGNYSGTRTFSFNFQLLDKEKNLIPKEKSDGVIASDNHWSFTSKDDGFWDYILTLTLDAKKDLLDDSNIFEFKYQYLKNEFSEEVYVIKNYAGKNGTSGVGYTIDLSNSFHTFAGEQAHAVAGQTVSFQIQAYYGDKELDIEEVSYVAPTGLDISYNETNRTITLTTKSGVFLTKDGNITFTIAVQKKEGMGTLNFIKIFNYSINYNGKSYYLGFGDNNTITYSPSTQTYNPSSIVVKAYSRNVNGEASVYTDGIIYYSFDKKNWTRLTKESISNYSNIDNIYFRLYSPQMKSSNLEENSAYLLDEETIPVLTSLDGVEIGGDNLLRWTRTMPIENNKWKLEGNNASSYITQRLEGDFTCTVFNKSPLYSYIVTPKEQINSEYVNKTFCFSCYVKIDNVELETNSAILALQLRLHEAFSDTTRAAYKLVGELSNRGSSYPKFICNEDLVENKWIKIYKTFTWNNFLDNSGKQPEGFDTTGGSCQYFSLSLYSGSSSPVSTVEIKKPKLEFGNMPSEWSASPYDIDYTNITGTNLIDEAKPILTFSNSYRLNSSLFSKDSLYTLSWSQVSYSGNKPTLTWKINDSSTNTGNFSLINNFQYTFPKQDADWYLTLTASEGEITFNELKIEKGTIATGYKITAEQANAIAEEQAKNAAFAEAEAVKNDLNSQIEELYKIPTIDGVGEVFSTRQDFIDAIEKYNKYDGRINTVAGDLEAQDTDILYAKEGIQRLEKSIQVVTSTTEPYIKIQADLQSDSSSKTNFLKLTPERLEFWSGTTSNQAVVAYMSNNLLVIKRGQLDEAIVKNYFNIGGLNFKITESGVGVVWDFNFNYAE
jgi:hypothetical protein